VTISLVTATTVFVVVTIQIIVVTIAIVTTTIWFAEAILTKRLVEATKSFPPCNCVLVVLVGAGVPFALFCSKLCCLAL